MSLTKPIYKKRGIKKKNYREAREPQSHNPIYRKELNCFRCPYSHLAGRKKRFKNLWSLYMHFTRDHPNENYRELTMTIADFIIRGILI